MDLKESFVAFILILLTLIWGYFGGYLLLAIIAILTVALVYLYGEYLNLKQQLPKKKPVEEKKKIGGTIVKVREVPGGYQVIFTDDTSPIEWINMTYGDFKEAVRWINETINHLEAIKKEVKMENDSGRRYRV